MPPPTCTGAKVKVPSRYHSGGPPAYSPSEFRSPASAFVPGIDQPIGVPDPSHPEIAQTKPPPSRPIRRPSHVIARSNMLVGIVPMNVDVPAAVSSAHNPVPQSDA